MTTPKRFVPSNPGGKPGRLRGKGLVEHIGRHTRDGILLADEMLKIVNGHDKRATVAHRIKAIEWLSDRYMGKSVDVSLIGDIDSPNNPLAELDADQLRSLISKLAPRRSVVSTPQQADAAPPAENAQPDAARHTQVGAEERIDAPTSPQTPETT